MTTIYNLERYVDAQAPIYSAVRNELAAGQKRAHWMWFIFPQIKGLGHSTTARHYSIQSLEEAKAYLAHDILGPRLMDCTGLVNRIEGKTAYEIFGAPDDMKFRSSMTLFAQATSENTVFVQAIDKYFKGEQDTLTREILFRQA